MPKVRQLEPINLGDGIKQEVGGGVYFVRNRVPQDVVGLPRNGAAGAKFGKFIKASTKTRDPALARSEAVLIRHRWAEEFDAARAGLTMVPGEIAAQAIDRWRADRLLAAAFADMTDRDLDAVGLVVPKGAMAALAAAASGEVHWVRRSNVPRIGQAVVEAANRYFDRHPDLARDPFTPPSVTIRLARLTDADIRPDAWTRVPDFEATLQAAVREGGAGGKVTIDADLRAQFVRVALEVAQHEEAARLRAAKVIAAAAAERLDPALLRPETAPPPYTVQPGEKTVDELIEAYRADVTRIRGPEVVGRRYKHMFAAFAEVLGSDRPVRTVARADARRIRDLLMDVPANATKKFPGLTLVEAAARARNLDREQEDEDLLLPRLAPATVTSYMDKLSRMMTWAADEGIIDGNPAHGLGIVVCAL